MPAFGLARDVAGLNWFSCCSWSLTTGAPDILGTALLTGRALLPDGAVVMAGFPSEDSPSSSLLLPLLPVSSSLLATSAWPELDALLLLCTLWSDGYMSKLLLSLCRNSDFLFEVGLWFRYWFNIGGNLVTGTVVAVSPNLSAVVRWHNFFSTNVRFLYKKYIFFLRCSTAVAVSSCCCCCCCCGLSSTSGEWFLQSAESLLVPVTAKQKNFHVDIR